MDENNENKKSEFEKQFQKSWGEVTGPIGGCLGYIAPFAIGLFILIMVAKSC